MVTKTASKEKNSALKPCALKKAPKSSTPPAGYKKKYFKTKSLCKVTFMLPGIAAPGAGIVCIVGDFNNWSIITHPMKRQKSGDFTITLDLEPGRQYQYRYLIDECRWENDWWADAYVTTPYGDSENSVVIV
jgi:1,4-alpha-glucan branching enzyme